MNGLKGVTRFNVGDVVWISPQASEDRLTDDEAVVIEDYGTGYLVLQESELRDSNGLGWFVRDVEVEPLQA